MMMMMMILHELQNNIARQVQQILK